MKPSSQLGTPLVYEQVTEQKRLNTAREEGVPWKKWGPYLSERQWGTVREDYSEDGNAWDYFSHDQSRSRAYRWGEDGMAGISDDKQVHLLPTLWFRNIWSWDNGATKPAMRSTNLPTNQSIPSRFMPPVMKRLLFTLQRSTA